jgi:hypothetical protein
MFFFTWFTRQNGSCSLNHVGFTNKNAGFAMDLVNFQKTQGPRHLARAIGALMKQDNT